MRCPGNQRRPKTAQERSKSCKWQHELISNQTTVSNPTFEHKLRSAHHFGRVHSSAVASLGVDGEGGVFADGVGVVVVVAFPGVVVVVEDEVPREEEHLRPHLAALAHPLAVQPDGQVRLGGQDGRVMLVRAVDDPACDARAVMVLQGGREKLSFLWAVAWEKSNLLFYTFSAFLSSNTSLWSIPFVYLVEYKLWPLTIFFFVSGTQLCWQHHGYGDVSELAQSPRCSRQQMWPTVIEHDESFMALSIKGMRSVVSVRPNEGPQQNRFVKHQLSGIHMAQLPAMSLRGEAILWCVDGALRRCPPYACMVLLVLITSVRGKNPKASLCHHLLRIPDPSWRQGDEQGGFLVSPTLFKLWGVSEWTELRAETPTQPLGRGIYIAWTLFLHAPFQSSSLWCFWAHPIT